MKKLIYALLLVLASFEVHAPPKKSRQSQQEVAVRRAEVGRAMTAQPSVGEVTIDPMEATIEIDPHDPLVAIAIEGLDAKPMDERIFYIVGALNPVSSACAGLKSAGIYRVSENYAVEKMETLEDLLLQLRRLCSDSTYKNSAKKLRDDFLRVMQSLYDHVRYLEDFVGNKEHKESRIVGLLFSQVRAFFTEKYASIVPEQVLLPLLRCLALVNTTNFPMRRGCFPAHTAKRIENTFAQFQADVRKLLDVEEGDRARLAREEAERKCLADERARSEASRLELIARREAKKREACENRAMYSLDDRSHERSAQEVCVAREAAEARRLERRKKRYNLVRERREMRLQDEESRFSELFPSYGFDDSDGEAELSAEELSKITFWTSVAASASKLSRDSSSDEGAGSS